MIYYETEKTHEILVYTRTKTHEGNDCLITKDAHVVALYDDSGNCMGYVATRSSIHKGWMGFDTRSQSFVYDADHKQEAIDWCEDYFQYDKEKDEKEVTE